MRGAVCNKCDCKGLGAFLEGTSSGSFRLVGLVIQTAAMGEFLKIPRYIAPDRACHVGVSPRGFLVFQTFSLRSVRLS